MEENQKLQQIMTGQNSQMSIISLALYIQSTSRDKTIIKQCHQIIHDQHHHMIYFGQYLSKQGIDPRLWTLENDEYTYWSPFYLNYSKVECHNLDRLIDLLQLVNIQLKAISVDFLQKCINDLITKNKNHIIEIRDAN